MKLQLPCNPACAQELQPEVQRAQQKDFEPTLLFHSSNCQAAACLHWLCLLPPPCSLSEGKTGALEQCILPKLAEDPATPYATVNVAVVFWELTGSQISTGIPQSQ